MNIYSNKRNWKFFLFIFAIIIVVVTFWFMTSFIQRLARDEKVKIEIWAKAISRKALLVNSTEKLFKKFKSQEKKYVQQWSDATKKLINAKDDEDISFYTDFINGNDNIPVIVTDENKNITAVRNIDDEFNNIKILTDSLRDKFTSYQPIQVNYFKDRINYIYYRNSNLYLELKSTLDDVVESFLNEVVENTISNEIIITDSLQTKLIAFSGDIDTNLIKSNKDLRELIKSFENKPIKVDIAIYGRSFIYYRYSYLLQQISNIPFLLFAVLVIFLIISYILFSVSRKTEQNLVWVGLAKETAHQIGTPLSSMLGWLEILKLKNSNNEAVIEMENDINRLKLISERFSKIGSNPELKKEKLNTILEDIISYFHRRINKDILIKIKYEVEKEYIISINKHLFVWVLENVIRNSVDSLQNDKGIITLSIKDSTKYINIDVEDNGKGINKSDFKSIFKPGFTTKNRGWGLGLSLAKRIIENYHKSKISVKSSIPFQSTVIRIQLRKL